MSDLTKMDKTTADKPENDTDSIIPDELLDTIPEKKRNVEDVNS
jgi:hypothetical protein